MKEELERLHEMSVISPIQKPTEWCAPVVVVPKSNGRVRLCVDLTKLNDAVKRERHMLPTVDYTLGQLAGAKYFSKLDANSGFHQIPLHQDSVELTTFMTPFGRYAYNRLPFGISSAPEYFQRQISSILVGLEGVVCQMDDIVVFGSTAEEHDTRLRKVLAKLQEAGITLNRDKCEFGKTRIKFLGYIISADGIEVDPDKVNAIKKLPDPENVGDVRRLLGMVNQLGKFLPNLADLTEPLRELLNVKTAWYWGQKQIDALNSIKEALCSSPILALYDPNLDILLTADASSYGLGATLLQNHDGVWRPVVYASRTLSDVEKRYAQIEKEALALTWASERFSDYLIGQQFKIETDHKPLVPIFTTKNLDQLTTRIQRFRMRMMRFSYTIVHVPGRDLHTADALSRAPVSAPSDTDFQLETDTDMLIGLTMATLPATDQRLKQIRDEQHKDSTCQELANFCQNGWPERSKLAGTLKLYWQYRADINIQADILFCGQRIIIPTSMQSDILKKIHEGHQGIHKCRERAKTSVFWPGLSKQIQDLVESCATCVQKRVNRSEPLVKSEMPDYPWQKVASDLFEFKGKPYLILVDYYSRYIEMAKLSNISSAQVINHMKSIFARHGIPEILVSDNGTQYVSAEFEEFSQDYGFTLVTSSPKHPSGNGEAERAVRTAKDLMFDMLKSNTDPYLALMNYRATPIHNGFSPSQLLMSRNIRTKLPVSPAHLKPEIPNDQIIQTKEQSYRENMKLNYDRRHGARQLPDLSDGDNVFVRDRSEFGTVSGRYNLRSYKVSTPTGQFRRNRKNLVVKK